MGLLDIFRRAPAIREPAALADFIDRQAAFVVQKGIYEYSRARAGPYSKILFREQEFVQAADAARWRAYPLGLAMVGEVIDGVLRRAAGPDRGEELQALSRLVLSVFDRYACPAALEPAIWHDARGELERQLQRIGLHAAKRVIDIPGPLAEAYFALMPIHEKMRGRDFETMHNYLKVTLCNIHDELSRRVDGPALIAAFRNGAG
jgi:hypothetical protein